MKNLRFYITFFLCFTSAGLIYGQSIPTFDSPINPDLYLIRPSDQLQVNFIKSKLTQLTLNVDPEGRIIHETLGIFDLAGKTLTQAREMLGKALKKYYNVDNIAITVIKPRLISINIIGAVRKTGIYKGYTSQRVSEIIKKAGGILFDGSRRWIVFSGGANDIPVDLDKAIYLSDLDSDPFLYAGNTITVPNKSNKVVQVVGEVNFPREIELLPDDSLELLLALAGGLRSKADTQAIQIINNNNQPYNGTIQGGDIIIVPPRERTANDERIAIFGAIINPGLYDFKEGMTLSDLINNAGSFLPDANSNLTTIFRKPRIDINGRITERRFPISHLIQNSDNIITIKLMEGDSIFVPIKVGYVTVNGEVRMPGHYPYVEGEDAKYYINNAGGFLPTANKKEISIYNPISKITSIASPGVIISDGNTLTVIIREELK